MCNKSHLPVIQSFKDFQDEGEGETWSKDAKNTNLSSFSSSTNRLEFILRKTLSFSMHYLILKHFLLHSRVSLEIRKRHRLSEDLSDVAVKRIN